MVNISKAFLRFNYVFGALFLLLLILHSQHYMPFIADDSLISLRYADRLVSGHGLTWTEGRPVEGYSNFLWIILIAIIHLFGIDLIITARLLGILCMSSVIYLIVAHYSKPFKQTSSLAGLIVGLLFFVSAAPIAVWAIGGMEQPLIAALLAGLIPLYWEANTTDNPRTLGLSFCLGMLCLTRPDGLLFTVVIVAAVLIQSFTTNRSCSWRHLMNIIAMPTLFCSGQLIFRLAYYNEWIPNTALVKFAPSSHHLLEGIDYIWKGIVALSPASFIAFAFIAAGLMSSTKRVRFVPLFLIVLVWLVYLMIIGGDIFPAYRHFIPVVIVLTYALIEGTIMAWDALSNFAYGRILLVSGLIAFIGVTALRQFENPKNQQAVAETWEWNGRSLALTLKEAFYEKHPLLAVTAAGCLPYWSELPCLDMLGLNDYYLAHHKPKDFGNGLLGHELGEGNYVLSRVPDIIVFHVGTDPMFRAGIELSATKEFSRLYARMKIATMVSPQYVAVVWLRVNSSKIGYYRNKVSTTIPACLMNAYDHTVAFLYQGRMVVGVDKDHPAGVIVENISENCRINVIGKHSERIEHEVLRRGKGVLIVLKTKSIEPLPVEAIVIQ